MPFTYVLSVTNKIRPLPLQKKIVKDVGAYCFCASLLRTQIPMPRTSCIKYERAKYERSMTPTFLYRNKFYLQLSSHCPRMNKKINVGSYKNFKISDHGTWNPAILRLQGA